MSKFSSLDSLKKEEEDREKNEYYAGGNDGRGGGSGLSVVGPDGGGNDPMSRIVRNAMGDTKEMGETGAASAPADAIKITLYRNGFTVNDGPFRDAEEPESKKFLSSLSDGYIPQELQNASRQGECHIALSDKRGEDYRPPTPPAYVAYSGDAMTLGGSSAVASGAVIIAPGSLCDRTTVEVNDTAPSTLIQVRLHNGKRIKLKLNHTHTVMDLVVMVIHAGGEPPGPYTFSAGYPPVDLHDLNETIADAGLVGAALTQKLV